MSLLKKLLNTKPKTLTITLPKKVTKQAESHRLLIIGKHLYIRKDEVEKKISEVINVKIAKGELIEVKQKPQKKHLVN